MRVSSLLIFAIGFGFGLWAAPAYAAGTRSPAPETPASSPAARAAYDQAARAVAQEDYKKAIGLLERVVKAEPRNADALNLLGYSHRKLGDFPGAVGYYEKALAVAPEHRGALEYLGEAYAEQGQLDRARELQARLRKACPDGCDELRELDAAIAKAGKTP
jgi:tetratricopeptide (TPR) repeat protein